MLGWGSISTLFPASITGSATLGHSEKLLTLGVGDEWVHR